MAYLMIFIYMHKNKDNKDLITGNLTLFYILKHILLSISQHKTNVNQRRRISKSTQTLFLVYLLLLRITYDSVLVGLY